MQPIILLTLIQYYFRYKHTPSGTPLFEENSEGEIVVVKTGWDNKGTTTTTTRIATQSREFIRCVNVRIELSLYGDQNVLRNMMLYTNVI